MTFEEWWESRGDKWHWTEDRLSAEQAWEVAFDEGLKWALKQDFNALNKLPIKLELGDTGERVMNFDYMTPEEEANIKPDMVNHPPHYTHGGVECIDALEAMLGAEGFNAYCRGTATKYLWRTGHKWNAEEDIKKAIWYLERLVK